MWRWLKLHLSVRTLLFVWIHAEHSSTSSELVRFYGVFAKSSLIFSLLSSIEVISNDGVIVKLFMGVRVCRLDLLFLDLADFGILNQSSQDVLSS